MKKRYYIGLDVHKETIAIACALEGARKDAIYHGTCGGSNPACEATLRKLAKKLGVKLQDLKICYEAGPSGFVLARRLRQLKVECVVMSPSKERWGLRSIRPTSDLRLPSSVFRKPTLLTAPKNETRRCVCRSRPD